jgi:hypothetical protein
VSTNSECELARPPGEEVEFTGKTHRPPAVRLVLCAGSRYAYPLVSVLSCTVSRDVGNTEYYLRSPPVFPHPLYLSQECRVALKDKMDDSLLLEEDTIPILTLTL